ncbi:DEAD-domain-containing protein [Saitoella complicata NRRL Y-17804]|uniref:RNA helicase n=1 Tax=Saitoella complicata (strain BCRC 22490 / CBS 7301 / JCM 7358 / NBRC 10748 / NRRL Y-17804) TaxID=698492 RepID=A0A0E9NG11_SAICN|nr:DEAD-domain-containing protein [Saitoella complicata NRRL Y-17804]ODQ50852.1 DEAD-domain-containing protein [Saitoella complicata NRRL Y-17804]GAO48345.1 hypothetical protein G7K_2518-t1 [Saitoella complicata NRRL Y-17804]
MADLNESVTFKSLGLDKWLVDALASMSIRKPTAIQAACIKPILEGNDCIGGARTGSGKTAAFALPILQKWSRDPWGVYALVLTPTRELALQIAEQFAALGAPVDLKHAVVVGGMDMMQQCLALSRRPHVVIATPGRLADIIRSNGDETIGGLKRCKFLVLDEADRLLNPSFADELEDCMSVLPDGSNRQTLLFTATMTDAIRQLTEQPPKPGRSKPFLHEVESSLAVPSTLQQTYILLPSYVREAYLHTLLSLEVNEKKSAIIFVNRTRTAELIRRTLRALGIRVTALHSDMPQRERVDSLGRFRAQAARVLVATDVASRGLDIPTVEMVVNYDLPRDPDDYVHRVGRTARAGRSGESVTFVSERDVLLVEAIEERVNAKMTKYDGVSDNMVVKNLTTVAEAKREAVVQMDDDKFGEQRDSRRRKREGGDRKQVKKRKE